MINKEDKDFLRNSVSEDITVPEGLSRENIVKLVSGEKQKSNKKGIIRRFAAVSVAACLMITGVSFLWNKNLFTSPENTEDINVPSEGTSQNTAENYDELLSFIKDYAKDYKKNNQYYYFTSDDLEIKEETDVGSVASPGGTVNMYNESVSDFSENTRGEYGKLNLREHAVAEADIFITDGQYLYCIDSYLKRLRIIKANPDGTLESVYEGKESLVGDKGSGDNVHYSGLYVYENYLIAGFSRYTLENYSVKKGCSGVQIYDISDKAAPVLKKEIAVDGDYVSSRIIDSSLVLVTRYSIVDKFEATDDSSLLPAVYNGEYKYNVPCDCILYSRNDSPESYVNIVKADLSDIEKEPSVSSYLGKVADTYCTKDTLYIIGYNTENTDSVAGARALGGAFITADNICTVITKADISGEKAEIKCRTEFKGGILNSYSIDEYKGYLRVAVNVLNEDNRIYVFNEKLEKVGEIVDIAKGEQIKSARFMGDMAYVVTFVQTDPLFVIDLSNPEKPEIKGEVKLPGFSSYLHPVGNGLLVGIGVGGTETGTDGSSKISLFDVSDPSSPKEIDALSFPTSSIGCEPKAFCSVSESSFLVTYENWGKASYENNYKFYTGALFVGVSDKKLTLNNAYMLRSGESVVRSTFIGDNVYVFSEGESGVASFNMNNGELIDLVTTDNADCSFEKISTPYSEILY